MQGSVKDSIISGSVHSFAPIHPLILYYCVTINHIILSTDLLGTQNKKLRKAILFSHHVHVVSNPGTSFLKAPHFVGFETIAQNANTTPLYSN